MSYKTDLYGKAALRRLRAIAPRQDRMQPEFQPVINQAASAAPSITLKNTLD